jgi:hypothetical protein
MKRTGRTKHKTGNWYGSYDTPAFLEAQDGETDIQHLLRVISLTVSTFSDKSPVAEIPFK